MITREKYLERLKYMNPVNVWYVTSLCEDLLTSTEMDGYRLHIWAIGSTVTGKRPQRNWNKPRDIDILVTHDGMLNGMIMPKRFSSYTEFEERFLRWTKRQSDRFEIIELGFYGNVLGSGIDPLSFGGAFLIPKVWSKTPINFVVPSESEHGKRELEKTRQGELVVMYSP